MAGERTGRVGILWRGAPGAERHPRLAPMFDALAAAGVAVEPVAFDDEVADAVRRRLLELDGVLVWVDPVMGERDRTVLDALLRDVSARGVWVSAHPDAIMKMGTKELLVHARDLPCGSDSHLYRTREQLTAELPARLSSGARVLKQLRGNAGIGVWKVQFAAGTATGAEALVEVQDAHPRGASFETLPLVEFLRRCEGQLATGGIVDQRFEPRITEGIVRCYLVRGDVVGFATQGPEPSQVASGRVFGLPSKKTMWPAAEARFASLRHDMESSWLPALQELVGVDAPSLPMLWDADFLYGAPEVDGAERYVLCEVNVSCVIPFPDAAPAAVARAVAERVRGRANAAG